MSTSSTSSPARIVVGVDGSPSSRAALRWGARQAALTGGTVDAVIVRHAPTSTGAIGGFGQSPAENADEGVVADQARATLDAIVKEEVKADDMSRVNVRVFDGHPAEALMAAAKDADLLAVGSRGHGGFAEVLLGSVSQYLVHHSNCPVIIFRGDARHLGA